MYVGMDAHRIRPHLRHGHSTKQGSPWGRWILQEAAQTANKRPTFAGTYAQLARRRGNSIATTAIARSLLARWFHILTQLEATTGEGQTGCARNTACASHHGR
jgi:hypothetical protein